MALGSVKLWVRERGRVEWARGNRTNPDEEGRPGGSDQKMARTASIPGLRWIQGYYLASPVFLLIGVWWGMEVRVTFIPDTRWRFLYYVALTGLGLLSHFRPRSAPWVALGESSLNLLLIILWILLPIYALSDDPLGAGPVSLPYTAGQVLVNGLLAGSFFLLGFYRAQGAILSRMPWIGPTTNRGPGRR